MEVKFERPEQPMDTVTIQECVITTLTRRGDGSSSDDPIRVVDEVWLLGKKIAERDPAAEVCMTNKKLNRMLEFQYSEGVKSANRVHEEEGQKIKQQFIKELHKQPIEFRKSSESEYQRGYRHGSSTKGPQEFSETMQSLVAKSERERIKPVFNKMLEHLKNIIKFGGHSFAWKATDKSKSWGEELDEIIAEAEKLGL